MDPISPVVLAVSIGCGIASDVVQSGGVGAYRKVARLLAEGSPPENHDILKATHQAYVAAMKVMAQAAEAVASAEDEKEAARTLKKLCGDKTFSGFRFDGEHFPLAEVNEAIDHLFTDRANGVADHARRKFNEIIVNDLAAWGVMLPPMLEALFLEGLSEHQPWHVVFRATFAEQIKGNQAAFRILTYQALQELRASGVTLIAEIEGLHSRFDRLDQGQGQIIAKLDTLAGGGTKEDSAARKGLKLAQDLMRDGKGSDARAAMISALKTAEQTGDQEEEVEILVALALTSESRRGPGDSDHYLKRAEAKAEQLASPAAKVIFLRARAAHQSRNRDFEGAEESFREALRICETEDDEKGNLATQGCIVRSSFVHLLCNLKRYDDARALLEEAETYGRDHPLEEEGELLQSALEAGMHLCIDVGDEDGAIARVVELEALADTERLADRIAGDLINVANRAAHRKAHRVALAAAQAGVRLGRRCRERSPRFLVGALYTEAMVVLKGGDADGALLKASALLDACNDPADSSIRQATQQLIAEIRRTTGDSQAAVESARSALSGARGDPEEVAFGKIALSTALNDNGQTEEALQQAKEAWELIRSTDVPPQGAVDVLSRIANYASQLGREDDAREALLQLIDVPDDEPEIREDIQRAIARAGANAQLRDRLLAAVEVGPSPATETSAPPRSIADANAATVLPLLSLWDGFKRDAPDAIAGMYDFWGRGNFERILQNSRRFPNSFNITLEVRSLEDVQRAIRVWGLFADFLILLWKGPTDNGLAVVPLPDDYDQPGGWGYMVCIGDVVDAGDDKRQWHPALGYSSMFPAEVAVFLATEARSFLASGRLIIVPAVGVGCINPGHGPFEQLLAEAGNAVPALRWRNLAGSSIGFIPHSPDAPFEFLAELADAEAESLRKLRLLLLRRSRQLTPGGDAGMEAKLLSMEIEDALRDFEGRSSALGRRKGLAEAREPIAGGTARFKSDGGQLSQDDDLSHFAPLFLLQSLGYGWSIDSPNIPHFPNRFEPAQGDVVGTWLAPPTSGWTIPTARRMS